MEDNCFTVLCWFLLYNNSNGHKYTLSCPSRASRPPHSPPHPSRSSQSTGLAPCPVELLPAGCPFYITVMCVCQATFSVCPPFYSPAMSTSLFPMSVSLCLPCKLVYQYHFSRFHICALISYQACISCLFVRPKSYRRRHVFYLCGHF